jgi:hypothetical protein
LGLSDDEIGQLNFLEYDALLKRKHMADDRLRLNAGYIYAAIYNTALTGDPNREAKQPEDIVPSMAKPTGPPDLRTMKPEEQKNYMFNVFMGSGKRSMR